MGIITSDEMRGYEFDDALNNIIDQLIRLAQSIGVYNETASGWPIREMEDAGFEAACSLLNELADVENWSSNFEGFEETPPLLANCMENLRYETTDVLESFHVQELCSEGRAAGEFWFQKSADEDSRSIIFGGRRRELEFCGSVRWIEVDEKTSPRGASGVKPRVKPFEDVEQFVGVDDTPFLEILSDVLDYWRKNRRADRLRVQVRERREADRSSANLLVPSPLQAAILKALDGKALKKQALADIVSKGEGSRLYRRGGLKELMAAGKVRRTSGRGYYRPDAPPPDAEKVAPL